MRVCVLLLTLLGVATATVSVCSTLNSTKYYDTVVGIAASLSVPVLFTTNYSTCDIHLNSTDDAQELFAVFLNKQLGIKTSAFLPAVWFYRESTESGIHPGCPDFSWLPGTVVAGIALALACFGTRWVNKNAALRLNIELGME